MSIFCSYFVLLIWTICVQGAIIETLPVGEKEIHLSNQSEEQDYIYNIGAVSRMTNIPIANLRMWERRYHFPAAKRTSGKHRLYSKQDIENLLWIRNRLKEGMHISKAIQFLLNGNQISAVPAYTTSDKIADTQTLAAMQIEIAEALKACNLETADLLLHKAMTLFSLSDIVLDIIGPTFVAIGEAWHTGTISITIEHFASNYLHYQLAAWMYRPTFSLAIPPVALICAPGEYHEGSLLMLGVLLREAHIPIAYIGQTLPLSELDNCIQSLAPSVIVLTAMTETTAQALSELPKWLTHKDQPDFPKIAFGGRAFIEHPIFAESFSGIYLGNTLQEGLHTILTVLSALHFSLGQ